MATVIAPQRLFGILLVAAVIDVFISPLGGWRAMFVVLIIAGIGEPQCRLNDMIFWLTHREPDRRMQEILIELDRMVHFSDAELAEEHEQPHKEQRNE